MVKTNMANVIWHVKICEMCRPEYVPPRNHILISMLLLWYDDIWPFSFICVSCFNVEHSMASFGQIFQRNILLSLSIKDRQNFSRNFWISASFKALKGGLSRRNKKQCLRTKCIQSSFNTFSHFSAFKIQIILFRCNCICHLLYVLRTSSLSKSTVIQIHLYINILMAACIVDIHE